MSDPTPHHEDPIDPTLLEAWEPVSPTHGFGDRVVDAWLVERAGGAVGGDEPATASLSETIVGGSNEDAIGLVADDTDGLAAPVSLSAAREERQGRSPWVSALVMGLAAGAVAAIGLTVINLAGSSSDTSAAGQQALMADNTPQQAAESAPADPAVVDRSDSTGEDSEEPNRPSNGDGWAEGQAVVDGRRLDSDGAARAQNAQQPVPELAQASTQGQAGQKSEGLHGANSGASGFKQGAKLPKGSGKSIQTNLVPSTSANVDLAGKGYVVPSTDARVKLLRRQKSGVLVVNQAAGQAEYNLQQESTVLVQTPSGNLTIRGTNFYVVVPKEAGAEVVVTSKKGRSIVATRSGKREASEGERVSVAKRQRATKRKPKLRKKRTKKASINSLSF